MLIEKLVEDKIADAISAALPASVPAHAVFGFWHPSAAGKLKWLEDSPEAVAIVSLVTSTIPQPTFSSVAVTFPVAVTLSVRLDRDLDGSALLAFAEPISNLFRSWVKSNYQSSFTALDVDGFSVCEVTVDGSVPSFDLDRNLVKVAWTLTLSGSFREPAATPTP